MRREDRGRRAKRNHPPPSVRTDTPSSRKVKNAMPFVTAVRTAHFRLYQRLHQQRVENGLYFRLNKPFTDTDLIAVLTALVGQWSTEVMPHLSRDLSLVGGRAMSLESETAPSVEYSLGTPVDGGKADSALPGNCAFVLKFSTNRRGRSNRGRVYLTGLGDAQVTGNRVEEPQAADILAGVKSVISALETTFPVEHVIISRTTNPATVRPVTQISYTDLNMDSQRRRLTGRGM